MILGGKEGRPWRICARHHAGTMGCGLQGLSRRGRRSYRGQGPACCGPPLWAMVFPFVGAPPPGRWVVVCEGYRDEGVAPTGARACIL
jgi:hypothetical protein